MPAGSLFSAPMSRSRFALDHVIVSATSTIQTLVQIVRASLHSGSTAAVPSIVAPGQQQSAVAVRRRASNARAFLVAKAPAGPVARRRWRKQNQRKNLTSLARAWVRRSRDGWRFQGATLHSPVKSDRRRRCVQQRRVSPPLAAADARSNSAAPAQVPTAGPPTHAIRGKRRDARPARHPRPSHRPRRAPSQGVTRNAPAMRLTSDGRSPSRHRLRQRWRSPLDWDVPSTRRA